jgi:hypothetical protein
VLLAQGILPSVPDYTPARWQFGVDMLYRTIKSDLIAVHEYVQCTDDASFFQAIRTLSPFEDAGGFLWNGTLIAGTEKLEAAIETYFTPEDNYRDAVNPAFIEAIENSFAANGVPWSDSALLPIVRAGIGVPIATSR